MQRWVKTPERSIVKKRALRNIRLRLIQLGTMAGRSGVPIIDLDHAKCIAGRIRHALTHKRGNITIRRIAMRTQLLAITVATTLALGLAACGKKDDATDQAAKSAMEQSKDAAK
ncbi:hypothetical protein I6F18_35485, partial [Bradyrhizobium sp. NBAIM32]|uniref:hypothetical protein n=1 Tax=Bradyrhizobium sp. NBAIM32 TaxID=2793809 RepID=UPI001CD6449B